MTQVSDDDPDRLLLLAASGSGGGGGSGSGVGINSDPNATAPHLDLVQISVKHQFYLILVALGVLICLSGNIIIYSHVCPLDM